MNLSVPQEWTSGPTMREMQTEILDGAKAQGREVHLTDDKYRWM